MLGRLGKLGIVSSAGLEKNVALEATLTKALAKLAEEAREGGAGPLGMAQRQPR